MTNRNPINWLLAVIIVVMYLLMIGLPARLIIQNQQQQAMAKRDQSFLKRWRSR